MKLLRQNIENYQKLLNASGLKPVQNLNESDAAFSGEWFVGRFQQECKERC
jgi:hypothetical protein